MKMDVEEAIRRRKSVRKYLDKKVEKEKIKKILEAGMLAPSAKNSQPWDFVIVQDQGTREKIAKRSLLARFISQAPVLIVGVGDPKKSRYFTTDVSIALQTMVLQATELGLGSCWIGDFREDFVKKLLDIPKQKRIVCMLTIGYQRFDRTAKEKVIKKISKLVFSKERKPLEQITHWEKFEK